MIGVPSDTAGCGGERHDPVTSVIVLSNEAIEIKRYISVAMVDRPRTVNGITVMPWRHFFDALWAGDYR